MKKEPMNLEERMEEYTRQFTGKKQKGKRLKYNLKKNAEKSAPFFKNNGSWFACYLYTYVTMKMSANFLSLHFHCFKTFEYDYLLKPLLFLYLCVCF